MGSHVRHSPLLEVFLEEALMSLLEGKWDDLKHRAEEKGLGTYAGNFLKYKDAGVNPKYEEFLWRQFVYGGGSPLQPPEAVKPLLQRFEELQKIKPTGFNPDITSYESVQDLKKSLDSFQDVSSKTKEKREGEEGSKVLFSDKNWLFQEIHTKEASCKYGQNTRWCISATKSQNYFDRYYKKFTDFWFLTHKPSGTKWAVVNHPDGSTLIFDQEDQTVPPGLFKEDLAKLGASTPIPEGLAKLLENTLGITLMDRILKNPDRVLKKEIYWDTPLRTLVDLVIQAQRTPERFSQEHLEALSHKLSYVDWNDFVTIASPEDFLAVRRFLVEYPPDHGGYENLTLRNLDRVRDLVMLQDPSLSDEEFYETMVSIPPGNLTAHHLKNSVVSRAFEVLLKRPRPLKKWEEETLWTLTSNHLNPAFISDEVILTLADESQFPYDYRIRISKILSEFLPEYRDEWLILVLEDTKRLQPFLRVAPPLDTNPETLSAEKQKMLETHKDLARNGYDPIKTALYKIRLDQGTPSAS